MMFVHRIKFIFFTFLLLINSGLQAQSYFFEEYDVAHGLASSKIYNVIQDDKDIVWLGSEVGVTRFDGVSIINYSSTDGMAGGGVYSLMQDTTGRIWFGHLNGGLSVFEGDKFHQLVIDSITLTGDITSIRQIDGYIWLTTFNNGAIRINFPGCGDTILYGKQYSGKNGLSDQISSSYLSPENEYYCIVSDLGIKRFNSSLDKFETFKLPGFPEYFAIVTMFEDSGGNLWLGTHNGGLYKREKSTGLMKIYDVRDGLANNMVTYITEDYLGNVWVGTWGGGISIFKNGNILNLNTDNGLNVTSIHCLLEDRERNMIIAGHYNGISIFKGEHFVSYDNYELISDKSVFAIEEDNNGHYWIGTNNGIVLYSSKNEKSRRVQHYDSKSSAIGDQIRFLELDKHDRMWIGTDGAGLSYYDFKLNSFEYDSQLNGYLLDIITALVIDKHDRLWVGNMDRLVRFDLSGKEMPLTYTQGSGLSGSNIKVLFSDKDDNIWIGTEQSGGLTKYVQDSNRFVKIDIDEGVIPQTIAQTADSRIWVGTTNGLYCIDDDTVSIVINKKQLLSDNIKLLQPAGNLLYIGTNMGLNRLNLRDSTIASFTRRNGFKGVETLANAVLADTNGELWFGTANGIVRLTPTKMPPINQHPSTHIKGMEVNMKPRDMVEGMKLKPSERSIVFSYFSVSLSNPDAVMYKVMLEGADDGWRDATTLTREEYPNLAPGHYTFKVQASNGYGYWDNTPEQFSFTIQQPYYLRGWFIICCIVVMLISLHGFVKIRERNLVNEKKILEEKVEERTAEVVQKSKIIEEKNKDITSSIRYAERIQRAMMIPGADFKYAFILFMPKDIVSGDFYWFMQTETKAFIAACDCTGHGVPGAFMSIMGHNSLNKIVGENHVYHPGEILNKLNDEIVSILSRRSDDPIKDGMDMTLVAFDKVTGLLEFAGAYNSLYIVHDGVMRIYKGNKFPIGILSTCKEKQFTNSDITVYPGDMLYMSSDGYTDQFGGVKGKRFQSANLRKLLLKISDLTLDEQRLELQRVFLEWKGNQEQVDDILIIGIRVPKLPLQ